MYAAVRGTRRTCGRRECPGITEITVRDTSCSRPALVQSAAPNTNIIRLKHGALPPRHAQPPTCHVPSQALRASALLARQP